MGLLLEIAYGDSEPTVRWRVSPRSRTPFESLKTFRDIRSFFTGSESFDEAFSAVLTARPPSLNATHAVLTIPPQAKKP